MKIYCMNEECNNRPNGYAICTALMCPEECPKRVKNERKNNQVENNTGER